MANGQMGTQPGQNPMANAGMPPGMGMQPGMGMGMQPGMGPSSMAKGMQPGMQPGKEPGKGDPMNMGISEGDKDRTGQAQERRFLRQRSVTATAASSSFGSSERDKVQQNAEAQFPAEFREMIKQYNINIKNSKPHAGNAGQVIQASRAA